MDELMKNELLEKLYFSQKDIDFRKNLEVNQSINNDLIYTIREILLYYVKNRIKSRSDVIGLRNVLNYIIKTGRCKYDVEKKFERLNRVIKGIK